VNIGGGSRNLIGQELLKKSDSDPNMDANSDVDEGANKPLINKVNFFLLLSLGQGGSCKSRSVLSHSTDENLVSSFLPLSIRILTLNYSRPCRDATI
jgi:hypothetical protein